MQNNIEEIAPKIRDIGEIIAKVDRILENNQPKTINQIFGNFSLIEFSPNGNKYTIKEISEYRNAGTLAKRYSDLIMNFNFAFSCINSIMCNYNIGIYSIFPFSVTCLCSLLIKTKKDTMNPIIYNSMVNTMLMLNIFDSSILLIPLLFQYQQPNIGNFISYIHFFVCIGHFFIMPVISSSIDTIIVSGIIKKELQIDNQKLENFKKIQKENLNKNKIK